MPSPDRHRQIEAPSGNALSRFLRLIRFSHTIFALPFALGALVVAANGLPSLRTFVLVIVCMVFARKAAMLFNRLVDWSLDQRNPRTAARHLLVSKASALVWFVLSSAGFVLAAAAINRLTFLLGPVALALIFLCWNASCCSRSLLRAQNREARSGRNQSRVFSEQRVCERRFSGRSLCGPIGLNDYIAFNIATRLSCRPPSKGVSSQIRTILRARSSGIRRSPMERTFASLCCRERRADSSFQQSAQRTPCTLFATIASPLPEPPKTIPRSHSPRATASAAGRMKRG